MKRLVALALPFAVAACGDNIKASDTDAAVDAAIDAEIDAPPAVFSGTISLQEVKLLAPGNSGAIFGQGPQASISFSSSATVPGPIMEEQVGSPLGCKAWSWNTAQTAAASVGVDEGPVTINTTAGTVRPTFPACIFQAPVGYICPELATASGGGTIAPGASGTATLTDADVTYTDANSTARYVQISGAAMAANNGVFPIVARPAPTTIVYGNPLAAAEVLPAAAMHINLAGIGPIPGAPDPGFMSNDVVMTFDHAMGGGNHVAAFTATTSPGTVGDDIGITNTEIKKLNAIPLDGTAFTISCDGANCGSATGTILVLRTTDAPTAGLSPFALPLPVTKHVEVRCAAIGQTSVTVPATYSALIQSSGATRIQATFIRPTLMQGGPATVNAISGHAIVGYTNR